MLIALSSLVKMHIAKVLLRLYYLYAKSPKKTHELADIVEDLKEVMKCSDTRMPCNRSVYSTSQ